MTWSRHDTDSVLEQRRVCMIQEPCMWHKWYWWRVVGTEVSLLEQRWVCMLKSYHKEKRNSGSKIRMSRLELMTWLWCLIEKTYGPWVHERRSPTSYEDLKIKWALGFARRANKYTEVVTENVMRLGFYWERHTAVCVASSHEQDSEICLWFC